MVVLVCSAASRVVLESLPFWVCKVVWMPGKSSTYLSQ